MKEIYNIIGREYKFNVTGGSTITLNKSDISGAKISGTTLQLPVGFQICDFEASIHSTVTSAKDINLTLHCYADGSQGVTLPSSNDFDNLTLYIYAERL